MKKVEYDYTEVFPENTNGRKTRYTDLSSQVNPIPSNSIVYKTITGIGATYSEFEAERHSIIMLPHISIIKSKQEFHKDKHGSFAVYNQVQIDKIIDYLKEKKGYAKFVTTPKGLEKIKIAIGCMHMDMYKEFFLLIDECHKQVRDAQYREDMIPPLDEFFLFDHKAMVSATPIPPSDPRFKDQGFKNIELKPGYDHRKHIKIIHSNGIINALTNFIQENPEEEFYVFFNSIEGIRSIIKALEIEQESSLFCSKENEKLLSGNVNFSVNSCFGDELAKKFNFFTSSFYNGLDILTEKDPVLIILTDVGFADFSMVDPFTDVLQIIGRLRNGYKHAVHINNSGKRTNPISETQAKDKVEVTKQLYLAIQAFRKAYTGEMENNYINQMAERLKPYYNLLSDDQFSYFKLDNYLMEERIKNYYKNARSLWNAYKSSQLYIVTESNYQIEKLEVEHLSHGVKKYSKSNVQRVVEQLEALQDFVGTEQYEQVLQELEQAFPVITQAYYELGIDAMKEKNYNIKAITKELIKKDVAAKKNSTALIEFLYLRFKLNTAYLCKDIKPAIQDIFDELAINATAVATDIEGYFDFDEYFKTVDGKRQRGYYLKDYKFNLLRKYRRA